MSNEEFIKRSIEIHGKKYDYSLVNYIRSHDKVKIICKEHGEFNQTANSHLNGTGCPICKESKGEKIVRNFLDKFKMKYIKEKTFSDCKSINVLAFDFYIKKHKICIEYDGIQHFKAIEFFGGEKILEETKKRDEIKNIYCIENDMKLIRIKYDENIEEKLIVELNEII